MIVNELQSDHPNVPGFAIVLVSRDGSLRAAASGTASPDGAVMTADTPVRVASITKTFVAAATLRLWEEGLLDLDDAIEGLLNPELAEPLQEDGYDLSLIKVRHLLGHTSGLADHVGDTYFANVVANPTHRWTPLEQVQVLVDTADPLSAPGEAFSYSDTGYVLLGQIIEEVTGESLHRAVRRLTKIDSLNLSCTWWDEQESPPSDCPSRAHQWIDGMDIYPVHGSIDAWGGGGVVASMQDVARFYAALFSGAIFEDADTLDVMIEAPGHQHPSSYRFGLFPGELDGLETYGHGGFWGTYALAVPNRRLVATGVALDQEGYPALRSALKKLLEDQI
jgi:D-alanyl-D-alanine carboxypeptidase